MAAALALVVDDEPFVRMLAVDALRDAEFEVVEAADALSALEMLRSTPDVRLICTDVHMPGLLDGVDLARLARWRHPDVRVIVVSGDTGARCQVPDFPFLEKPFNPASLVELALADGRSPTNTAHVGL